MPSERIRHFYDCESFAIIGMSKARKNFAWTIFEQLSQLGKRVYPININAGNYQGAQFYRSLTELPETPEAVILSVDPASAKGMLEELKDCGAKYIWFQQGSFNDEVLSAGTRIGLDPIKGCVLMNMPEAAVIHRFHRAINEFFGKGYK